MPAPAAWYCPSIRNTHPDVEPICGAGLATAKGTSPTPFRWVPHLSILGRRVEVHLSVAVFRGLLVGLAYLGLWSVLPSPLMERGGYVFDPLLVLFVGAMVGGGICHLLRLPALVGILLVCIAWGNLADGYFTEGIVPELRFITSRLGLAVIVSRAGFAVNPKEIKKFWKNALALSLVPMVLEAVVHAVLAKELMGYPDYRWAFIQGFVVSGIAPGVVVPPLLDLREAGFGHTGPTSLMLSSVVLDSVGSIWATSFFIDLVFSDLHLGLAIALGPIQLIGGSIIGALLAFLLHGMTKVLLTEVTPEKSSIGPTTGQASSPVPAPFPSSVMSPSAAHSTSAVLPPFPLDSSARKQSLLMSSTKFRYPEVHLAHMHYKVVVVYSAMAVAMVFLGERFSLAGGGAIGVLSLAATLAYLWAPPPPPATATPPAAGDVESTSSTGDEEMPEVKREEAGPYSLNGKGHGGSQEELSAHSAVAVTDPEPVSKQEGEEAEVIEVNPTLESNPIEREDLGSESELKGEELLAHQVQQCEERYFPAQRQKLFAEYAFLWDNIVMPALFAMAGSNVRLYETFDSSYFPMAIVTLLVGVAVRFLCAGLCSFGQGFSFKESAFVSCGWLGKAAVQAALGGKALQRATEQSPQNPDNIYHAERIQRTAMLAAMFMAPISACAVVILGRRWLPQKVME